MRLQWILTALLAACVGAGAGAQEHDYYRYLRYPKTLVPGVGRDKVEQQGGPDAVGYHRRTVQWSPRQGQDIVDIPEGAPLRTWTRNKGQTDKEALGGLCRNWTTSDDDTFQAHLIGFRGFGIETPDPRFDYRLTPAAVLRMENGERRAVLAYPPFHMMVSQEDHEFIHGIWRKQWKKIQAAQSQEEHVSNMYRVKPDAAKAQEEKVDSGEYDASDWWERGKVRVTEELTRRVKFLQRNAKGHRHTNGGGFVADSARVAATAYVGSNAMVLDGARVEDNACIHEYAVVHGPKTVIRENAKIGGKAWVFGDITVGGNARIMESVTVTTISRSPVGRSSTTVPEGQAKIDGNVVLKGEHTLRLLSAKDQKLTGELVMDYTPGHSGTVGYYELIPGIASLESGIYQYGRICGKEALGSGAYAGALYANWQFNQPKTFLMEDSYVNNNGILYGKPRFVDDGQRRCIVFNGKNQYAEAPPSVADFGELTIDMLVKRSGGGRLFDFGTSDDECFFLAIDGPSGKPTLVARHHGRSDSLSASEDVPANQWVRLRVEMDGVTASIHLDGKQVAKQGFAFRPRTVFLPDRPEGNYIACGRNQDEFFNGSVDHFRIYRAVDDDFDALGPVPFALTQIQEWSEEDQQFADAWEGRRRAKDAELMAGRYGDVQGAIRQLQQQKSALHKTPKLVELETRIKEADRARNVLNQAMHKEFQGLRETAKAQEELDELRNKMDAITREIRENSEYVELTENIRARERQRAEIEKEVRESPEIAAIAAKNDVAKAQKRSIEESIKQLPEMIELQEKLKQEHDNEKKRAIQEEYNRQVSSRRLSDVAWHKADIADRQLNDSYREMLRAAMETHPGRKELESQLQQFKENLNALTTRLQTSHPEYTALQKSREAKERDMRTARNEFEQRTRAGNDYQQAESKCSAARKAFEEEKRRAEQAATDEATKLDERIARLQKESNALRDNALRRAGLLGRNPYPGLDAARLREIQQRLKYHTTADWDYRTREEVRGTVTPKMKEWLLRVRGY